MKTINDKYIRHHLVMIISLVLISGQLSPAQSYFNINFSNSTNKYSLITEVKSITFDESGGIVVKKTDNSITTETLTLMKSITLDESSGGGSPLPVELQSFTVTQEQQNIQLKWKTATEVNNIGFEIEKLSNSKISNSQNSFWRKIGFVEGNGTTNSPKEYSYIDRVTASGTYQYRLKQIDRDGKFEYSTSVEVTIGGTPTVFALEQNYPNPFNPTTAISYQLSAGGLMTLIVYDAVGRVVATLVNERKEAGTYSASFNGSKLSSGIYFAKLTSGGKSQMRKIVLMK